MPPVRSIRISSLSRSRIQCLTVTAGAVVLILALIFVFSPTQIPPEEKTDPWLHSHTVPNIQETSAPKMLNGSVWSIDGSNILSAGLWHPSKESWPVTLLNHAKQYLLMTTHATANWTDERIKLAETVERCTKVSFQSHTSRSVRLSLRHPICLDALEKYKKLPSPLLTPSSRTTLHLPPTMLADVAANVGYCGAMTSFVWKTLVPQLSEPLQQALKEQRKRQIAATNGTKSQKFLVWSLSGGLGNRFQSLSGTLVAAMLSGRVLLVKDWFTQLPPNSKLNKPTIFASKRTAEYVLEPLQKLFNEMDDQYFAGDAGMSSDLTDLDFEMDENNNVQSMFLEKPFASQHPSVQSSTYSNGEQLRPPNSMLLCSLFPMMSLSEYRALYPGAFGSEDESSITHRVNVPSYREDHIKVDISARHDKKLRRWNRFACANDLGKEDQGRGSKHSKDAIFFEERFVYVWTNQYYVPLFFSNPHTRATMLQWFPAASDGAPSSKTYAHEGPYNVLTKLLVIPSAHVMRRVITFLEANENSPHNNGPLMPGNFISLQVRAFNVNAFGQMAEAFNECFKAVQNQQGDTSKPFFLASLHQPIREYFSSKYGVAAVTLSPPSHEQGTGKNFRLDLDALADMFILSLSGKLLVSPGSTFGGFVAAFADLNPIRIDYHRAADAGPAKMVLNGTAPLPQICQLAQSQQPCFGSWFRYDKLWHRKGELSCELQPMVSYAHKCEV